MPKAAVRNGLWDGSFFAFGGAGAIRMTPSALEDSAAGLCNSSVDRLAVAGRASASCEGATGFEGVCCCAVIVTLRDADRNTGRTASFRRSIGTLFRLA